MSVHLPYDARGTALRLRREMESLQRLSDSFLPPHEADIVVAVWIRCCQIIDEESRFLTPEDLPLLESIVRECAELNRTFSSSSYSRAVRLALNCEDQLKYCTRTRWEGASAARPTSGVGYTQIYAPHYSNSAFPGAHGSVPIGVGVPIGAVHGQPGIFYHDTSTILSSAKMGVPQSPDLLTQPVTNKRVSNHGKKPARQAPSPPSPQHQHRTRLDSGAPWSCPIHQGESPPDGSARSPGLFQSALDTLKYMVDILPKLPPQESAVIEMTRNPSCNFTEEVERGPGDFGSVAPPKATVPPTSRSEAPVAKAADSPSPPVLQWIRLDKALPQIGELTPLKRMSLCLHFVIDVMSRHGRSPPELHGLRGTFDLEVRDDFRTLRRRSTAAQAEGPNHYTAPDAASEQPTFSEMFTVGLVVFELLEGHAWIDRIRDGVELDCICEDSSVLQLSRLPKTHSSSLGPVLQRCWHRDPKRRPMIVELLRAIVVAVLEESDTQAANTRGKLLPVLDQLLPRETILQLEAAGVTLQQVIEGAALCRPGSEEGKILNAIAKEPEHLLRLDCVADYLRPEERLRLRDQEFTAVTALVAALENKPTSRKWRRLGQSLLEASLRQVSVRGELVTPDDCFARAVAQDPMNAIAWALLRPDLPAVWIRLAQLKDTVQLGLYTFDRSSLLSLALMCSDPADTNVLRQVASMAPTSGNGFESFRGKLTKLTLLQEVATRLQAPDRGLRAELLAAQLSDPSFASLKSEAREWAVTLGEGGDCLQMLKRVASPGLSKCSDAPKREASSLSCLAVCPATGRVAAGSFEGMLHVWDAAGTVLVSVKHHADGITSLVFLNDESLVTVGSDRYFIKYDASVGNPRQVKSDHKRAISKVVHDSGDLFFTGGRDNTVRWTLLGVSSAVVYKHQGWVSNLELRAGKLLSVSLDGTGVVLDVSGLTDPAAVKAELVPVMRFSLPDVGLTSASVFGDWDLIAAGTMHGAIHLWDGRTGAAVKSISIASSERMGINSIAFCGPEHFAASSNDKCVRLWSTDGTEVSKIEKIPCNHIVAMSENATRALCATDSGVQVVETATMTPQATSVRLHAGGVIERFSFDASETLIGAAVKDKAPLVWALGIWKEVGSVLTTS